MTEELITTIILTALGLFLVLFPKPIAAFYCRFMKELWRLHRDDIFARTLAGMVWVVERVSLGTVYDEATAPKAFRFVGFWCLAAALVHVLFLF
jgi:hypothetical protein